MEEFLVSVGINIASSVVYDCIKILSKNASRSDLEKDLITLLKKNNITDAEIKASKLVQFLISRRELEIGVSDKLTINLKDIHAQGDVTWLDGSTSNPALKEIFQNKPIDIAMHNIYTHGDVTWMRLNVDWPAELRQPLIIQGDFGSVKFNPNENCKIIFWANS